MTGEPDGSLAAAIAEELTACRQRGIERLDVTSHNQSPVQTPVLNRLASEYVTVRQVRATTRIPQLKYLFRDAIEAFAAENEADAQLVGDLFFGDSQNKVTKSAGELLDLARKSSGYSTEALFRRARHDAFGNFARFILGFVEDARQGNTDSGAGAAPTGNVSVLPKLGVNSSNNVPLPEVQRQHDAAAPAGKRHDAAAAPRPGGWHAGSRAASGADLAAAPPHRLGRAGAGQSGYGAGMTSTDEIRGWATALPEVEETSHFRFHVPVFKVRGRTFLGMGRDETTVVFCVSEQRAAAAAAAEPAACAAVRRQDARRNFLGLQVVLSRVLAERIRSLVEEAWHEQAPKRLVAERDRGVADLDG